MSVDADIGLRLGELDLGAHVSVGTGETLALLGPNGAGKTTLLRVLAGLAAIDRGSIVIDGRVVDDPAAGTFVAAEDRSVGYVFQDQLLFPHLDAVDNVAFGLRCRGVRPADARTVAGGWLDRVGLGELGGARPSELSGGQAQRVALARALAPDPAVLLLDEPLSALDTTTRLTTRRLLADTPVTTVVVTHDPIDARVLADRVAVLDAGTVTQWGTPDEVAAHPASPWVARLLGVNLVAGVAEGAAVTTADGDVLHLAEAAGGPVWVVFEPNAVVIHTERPSGSSRNVWRATVTEIVLEGDRVRLVLDRPDEVTALVTREALEELALRPGSEVWAALKATELTTRPR